MDRLSVLFLPTQQRGLRLFQHKGQLARETGLFGVEILLWLLGNYGLELTLREGELSP